MKTSSKKGIMPHLRKWKKAGVASVSGAQKPEGKTEEG